MAWRKQLKANKHWVFTVSENCLGHLLICDLYFSRIGCSVLGMRGLTPLELQLGNAFGKTEDVLEEDTVVSLAWQICIGLGFSSPLRWEIDYIIFWGKYSLQNSWFTHTPCLWCSVAMTSRETKQLPCQKASISLEQAVPQEVCVSPSSCRCLLLLAPGFLLRYLFPLLYIVCDGLWISESVHSFQSHHVFVIFWEEKHFSLGVQQDKIFTDFYMVFGFGLCTAFYISPHVIPHPLWTIE